jgi:hypothetical protein
MKKQRIEYTRPLDALIAITKRLCRYEQRYNMESELCFIININKDNWKTALTLSNGQMIIYIT